MSSQIEPHPAPSYASRLEQASSTPQILRKMSAQQPKHSRVRPARTSRLPEVLLNKAFAHHEVIEKQPAQPPPVTAPTILVQGVEYTVEHLQGMGEILQHARLIGEFPPTKSSNLDHAATVEDYQHLTQLRDVRGDLRRPVPGVYKLRLAQINRQIEERDSRQTTVRGEEGTGNANCCLHSRDNPHLGLGSINTGWPHPDSKQSPQADMSKEDILEVFEQAVEQNMADAMAPLRLNLSRLNESLCHFGRENTDLKDQNDTLSRQIDLHYKNLQQHTEACSSHIKALESMFEPQSKNLQAATDILTTTADNLTVVSCLVSHLSQVVTNLPNAINQVVADVVQQQTKEEIEHVMHAQQEAMLWIQQNSPPRQAILNQHTNTLEAGGQILDIAALVASVAKQVHHQTIESKNKARQEKGRFGRVVCRLFRGRQRHGRKGAVSIV